MASWTRRQFIKIGSTAVGGAAVASGLGTRWWGLDANRVEDPATDGDEQVPTICEMCFWGCGALAHVKDGRVTKLAGNPAHPLSRGKLCPRGMGGLGLLYDPDRLQKPLVRKQKRGEDVFEEVSWETALDKVAEGLRKVKEQHGPEALALFTHGSGGSWFRNFMKAYGSPNIGAPSYAQCRGPREAGFGATFGQGLGSPEPVDIAEARCITLIGSHLGENMHNTQVQELAEAVSRGADLVVVDPRYSVVAGKARYWLPIKPGTDIALLLAWMNVIIGEKRYDRDYVDKYAAGFAELEKHVADKTPEWAYPLTGLTPELIRDSARFIAGQRPASLIHPGRRSVWYGDDTQRIRAMAILAALLGSWGRRGGYLNTARAKLPPYPLPKPEHTPRPKVDKPKAGGFPLAEETLASGLRAASIPGTAAYDIKAWLVYGCNLMQALPDARETEKAIQALDFIVAVDVLPSEIVGYADVVLPEATYLEREDDLWNGSYTAPFIALRRAAVAPMYDSKPGWWIAQQLGQRLGLEAYFPWKDALEVVKTRAEAGGYDWKQLWSTGVAMGEKLATCEEEGAPVTVATESGKIELYSHELEKLGFDPLPEFYPQEEGPPGMFRLLTGRAAAHTFGRTTNNRLLAEVFPENEVWLNATVAKSLPGFDRPLRTGERVVLVNQDGVRSDPVRVKVTERIRGDCVYLVHGWGHSSRGLKYGFKRGASDSQLITRYKVDPLSGGTALHGNFVRLEGVEKQS